MVAAPTVAHLTSPTVAAPTVAHKEFGQRLARLPQGLSLSAALQGHFSFLLARNRFRVSGKDY